MPAWFRLSLLAAALSTILTTSAAAQSRYFSGNDSFGLRGSQAARSRSVAYYRPAPRADEPKFEEAAESTSQRPTVSGSRAVLKRGVAYAPENAPENIKRAIWAVNTLRRKPYKWGGGHGSFLDSGYDCSGAVSFALHHAGVLKSPMASGGFKEWGDRGMGRWITVYAQKGHVFAVIAGLRLDTTGYRGNDGPRWRRDARSGRGFTQRHVAGL